jgi:hypothetical protein
VGLLACFIIGSKVKQACFFKIQASIGTRFWQQKGTATPLMYKPQFCVPQQQ